MQKKDFQIVVLAKQVPDTKNVGKDAMNADGTINRAALPAIFNPDDMKALEMALMCRDRIKAENNIDVKVTVITMGPPRANEIIREALYRGADDGFVVSDKRFAGSDTLATSYALSMAIKKLGHYDIVFTGRQAIDGDTAQVGPQTAASSPFSSSAAASSGADAPLSRSKRSSAKTWNEKSAKKAIIKAKTLMCFMIPYLDRIDNPPKKSRRE